MVLWCITSLDKRRCSHKLAMLLAKRKRPCYFTIFPVILRDGMQQTLQNITSTGYYGSSGVFIMLVSVAVYEKLPRQKVWRRRRKKEGKEDEHEWISGHFRHLFKLTPTRLLGTFSYFCVHSVENSTLILTFDPFCFSLFLKRLPKFRLRCPNYGHFAVHRGSCYEYARSNSHVSSSRLEMWSVNIFVPQSWRTIVRHSWCGWSKTARIVTRNILHVRGTTTSPW